MTRRSEPELLVLHAVRVLGFANADAVAEHSGTTRDEAARSLRAAERNRWVQHVEFAGLAGWSLTDSGREENGSLLARERTIADPTGTIAATYRDFLPLNERLLTAVTDWQLLPTATRGFAPNDHTDHAWDERVLDELAALGKDLAPLTARLSDVLTRFDGYATRYRYAVQQAWRGNNDWVDKTDVDSCHRVWFQLHEDLLATLGIDRRHET